MISGIVTSVMVLTLLSACSSKSDDNRYRAEFFQLFDTVTEIVGYSDSKDHFNGQVSMIRDKLEEYHQLFDIYNTYDGINNIKTINDHAGISAVKVDQRLINLLNLGIELYKETDGKVNIAYGSVLSVWHKYREDGINDPEHASLPPMELLQEAAGHTDITKLIIDPNASTVYLEDPDMSLDVGAIAKGYSVEQTARYAVELGVRNMLISVGGNVRAIGTRGTKEPWIVAVQNPDLESEQKNLFNVQLKNASLVSSGNYQRYYTVDGRQYHHIIDPDTLMPSGYFSAVSILCRDSGQADALSTAIYNMPLEQGMALIESMPDTEALWVYPDGKQVFSSGFEDLIIIN